MRKLMLTLGLFAALGVCAQETIKTTANKFNGYGIVYSLPQTASVSYTHLTLPTNREV